MTKHLDNPLGLNLMPYSVGEHWLTALQVFSQCSLAAACHLVVVTCSKHNTALQEQNLLVSYGIHVLRCQRLDPERQCSVGNQMGVNNFAIGITHLGLQRPVPDRHAVPHGERADQF